MRGLLAGVSATEMKKAIRNPRRALLRLVLRSRLSRPGVEIERERLLRFLSERYGVDAYALLDEYRTSPFLEWFRSRRASLARYPGPYRLGTTGEFGCEALYLLVRAALPRTVVETGVLYGASSAHILAALARNGAGALYSVELGRDPREPSHDHFVPGELRRRWRLIIGDSRQVLPALLDGFASIDMFYHDSLHTYAHMTWEFATALPYLSRSGILATDDVRNPPSVSGIFREAPFQAFCGGRGFFHTAFHNLGVALPASAAAAERAA
jgi:predicted O-methyltransferase YrrM